MKSLVPEHIIIDRLRNTLLSDFANYQRNPDVYAHILRYDFYHQINFLGQDFTRYYTTEAVRSKKVTYDHMNAPRRMCDVLLWKPELLYDVDKFNEVIKFSRYTIAVTKKQNDLVKQRPDGSIKNLSINLYPTITSLWYKEGEGNTEEFPTHFIYPLLTEYEKTLL